MPFMPSRRLLFVLALLLFCLLPFVIGLHGPFLHDDFGNLPLSRVGPFSWQALWDASTRNASGPLGRPLSNASFAMTRWVLGSDPFDFKLVNLLLHGLCGLLVYALAKRLLSLFQLLDEHGRHLAALVTMAVWTLHPLQVSTVLYAVQRMAQLGGLFIFIGCCWFAYWLESGRRTPWRALAATAGFGACMLLGIAGKETAALLPVLAGVIALLSWTRGSLPQDRSSALFLLLCVVLPSVAGMAGMLWKWDGLMSTYAIRDFTLGERLLTESVALWFYLRLIVLPWIPAMGLFHDDFPLYGMGDWQGWLAIAAWLLALAAAWHWRKRTPMLLFALAWFLAAHLLESTVLPLELVYEHRNYFALLGPAIWLGHMAASLMLRVPSLRRVGWLLPLLLLAAATMTRTHQWSSIDLFAIYEHAHHPDSVRAMFPEAGRLAAIGKTSDADAMYARIKAVEEAREPGKSWPLMMDALIQCRNREYRVDWPQLQQRLRSNPSLDKMPEFSSAILSELSKGGCKQLEIDMFRDTLRIAWESAMARQEFVGAELAASHLAWSWKFSGNGALSRTWLRRAANTHPAAVEPLFDLAYQSLNAGDMTETHRLIDELTARQRQTGLPIGYRIDELKTYLQQAGAKATRQ